MDKIRTKAASARNRVAEATSSGRGRGSLSVPHASLAPNDNASTTAVNEGVLGPQPATTARDFAAPADQPTHQPVLEPPTSLESSVDAGAPVPLPAATPSQPLPSAPSHDAARPQQPSGRARSNSASQRRLRHSRPAMNLRQPSIGIRREDDNSLRPAVSSDPNAAASTSRLPALDETCEVNHTTGDSPSPAPSVEQDSGDQGTFGTKLRRLGSAAQAKLGLGGKERDLEHARDPVGTAVPTMNQYRDYAPGYVDVLDTLDPEVQTITSLTNVQNSLFVPNLGRFVNRRPTYTLRRPPSEAQSLEEINKILKPVREAQQEEQPGEPLEPPSGLGRTSSAATVATLATIDSHLSDSRYAVLPHGASLDGWSKEDKQELNDHVRHMLHSRRSKFKRSMRGFGQYVSKPLGFLVTLYATLITLFGLAWVLFLIGWINVGGKKDYIVNIIDNVLVALFAIVGDGLIPFRIMDTYHMIYIAHYHHYTWSRRKKDRLPELEDHNDLPTDNVPISQSQATDSDPEKAENFEFTVLTPQQQRKLEHHTEKFCKSHSFYKPHETETHHAFPLRLLVAIVVILDFHSIFQVCLGATTWGINYHERPFALTTVILCCSITCNATGGLLIWIGDKRTRKNDVLERMNRQELTEHAIHKVEKRRERESESEREDNDDPAARRGRRSLDLFRRDDAPSSSPHGSGHGQPKVHKHHDKYGHLGHLGHRDKGDKVTKEKSKEKEVVSSPLKQATSAEQAA